MPGTEEERIFEELKKFLNHETIWQKVLVPQHDLLKSFGTPTTKLKIAQNVFVPLLQLYSNFRTPDIEQKKKKETSKEFTVFLNYVFMFKNVSQQYRNNIKLSTFLMKLKLKQH